MFACARVYMYQSCLSPRFGETLSAYFLFFLLLSSVICLCARRTAAEKAMVNPINHFTKPFFYKHVETFIEKGSGEEIIPLMDYYHRFTRSVFWELEDMIPFSNHPLYRYLWGWMGAPEVALLKLFQGPVIRKASVYAHVVQEAIVPVSSLAEGVDKFDEWFGVYPLLVFPLRFYHRKNLSGFFHPDPKHCVEGKDWVRLLQW